MAVYLKEIGHLEKLFLINFQQLHVFIIPELSPSNELTTAPQEETPKMDPVPALASALDPAPAANQTVSDSGGNFHSPFGKFFFRVSRST